MSDEITQYGQRKDLAELEKIEKRLAADPQNLELMDWVAFMFYSNGLPQRALEYYVRLAEARPGNPSYAYFLGNLHHQMDDQPAARVWWDKVLSLDLEGEYAARARRKLDSLDKGS